MERRKIVRPEYSRAELLSDAIVHIVGIALALSAVPALIVLAAVWRGDATAITGIVVYGASLIAMLACSALYNTVTRPGWTGVLRRLDHSMIYVKIAGTYTPFVVLSGGHGAALLTGLWGAAVAGSGLKVIAPHRFRWFSILLYLGMGWAGALAGGAFFEHLSTPVFVLILIGGGLYTIGLVFHIANRIPFHNTIWHVFVLVASMVLFAAVTLQLADSSAIAEL